MLLKHLNAIFVICYFNDDIFNELKIAVPEFVGAFRNGIRR